MSHNVGDPPGSPVNTPLSPREAKAQAKAAKAYAKAQRPWYKKKRFLLPLILLLIILIVVIANALSGGDDEPSGSAGDLGASSTPGASGSPAFAGAKDDDVIGAAGATLTLGDADVTATTIVPGDATLGATLCSTVTLKNSADDAIDFNAFDWKLQLPSGTIANVGLTGSENILTSGQIAPGGTASGDVCFDADADPGQYVLLYEPVFSFFSDRRAAWVNDL